MVVIVECNVFASIVIRYDLCKSILSKYLALYQFHIISDKKCHYTLNSDLDLNKFSLPQITFIIVASLLPLPLDNL